jgi:hypothetical protein
MTTSAFHPYCRLAGVHVYDSPVSHNGGLFYEVAGCDFWLVAKEFQFYVVNSAEETLSGKYWNPALAVDFLVKLQEMEQDNLIAA